MFISLKLSIFRQVKAVEASCGVIVPKGHKQRYVAQTIPRTYAELAEKRPLHHSSSPPQTWYSIAILTATPFSTCFRIWDWPPSTT